MIKSGQYVYLSGLSYLFLGYSDYKRMRGIIADKHGNRVEVWVERLSY